MCGALFLHPTRKDSRNDAGPRETTQALAALAAGVAGQALAAGVAGPRGPGPRGTTPVDSATSMAQPRAGNQLTTRRAAGPADNAPQVQQTTRRRSSQQRGGGVLLS